MMSQLASEVVFGCGREGWGSYLTVIVIIIAVSQLSKRLGARQAVRQQKEAEEAAAAAARQASAQKWEEVQQRFDLVCSHPVMPFC